MHLLCVGAHAADMEVTAGAVVLTGRSHGYLFRLHAWRTGFEQVIRV